jgi:apolipoprotein N-acyltransferase
VIPGAPESQPWIAARISQIVRASDAWLLAGGPYYDDRGRIFNSAYLYSPTGILTSRYDKVKLVPFGEYVPGRHWLPLLSRYHVRDFDFAAGAVHGVLQAGTIAVGPMICFESIFPTIAWQLGDKRAQVLVIITNDAWFGRTAAAAQHQQIAVLRAIETGRWVLRGASTGVSSIIAPNGKVVSQAGLYQQAVLSANIALATGSPSDSRGRMAFAWLMVALSIAYLIVPAALPRGRATGPSTRRTNAPRRRGRTAPR